MRLADLLHHVDVLDVHVSGRITRDPGLSEVRAVTRDSREAGPGVVYVAVRGGRVDGHDFVGTLAGGVAVVEREVAVPDGVVRVRVPDTRRALAQLAAALHGHPARAVPVVGITGTNGKTTITTLCEGALSALGRRGGRIGTLGAAWWDEERVTGLTTPEAPQLHGLLAEMRSDGVEAAFVEVSSISLDQRRVEALPFHTALFTNLSRDHLDFHGSMDAYAAAKAQLFQADRLRPAGGLPRAILCGDDPSWSRMEAPDDRWLYGFGEHNDLRIEQVQLTAHGQRLQVKVPGAEAPIMVVTSLVGAFNALNVVGALAALRSVGLSWEQAAEGLAAVPGVPGRLERVPAVQGAHEHGLPAVFVDYAHTPDALAAALRALRPLATDRLVVVFGCGGDRDRGKRAEMGAIAQELADRVVITSDNPRSEDPAAIIDDILKGVSPQGPGQRGVEVLADRAQAIEAALWRGWRSTPERTSVVLIAGKGHEKTQEINGSKIPFDDVQVARHALERVDRVASEELERMLQPGPDGIAIAGATGGELVRNAPAGRVLTDTRVDLTGAWFVALVGPRFDGHAYLTQAAAKGAIGAVVSRHPGPSWTGGLVVVPDTMAAMADLGRWARARESAPVVGITGSSGKTTTRALTACALSSLGRVHQTVGNLNNHLGVPMTLLATPPGAAALVVEMGTSGPGEIRHLAEIGTPTHRLIINVGPAHLEELGGLDGVAVEKGAMFDTASAGDTLLVNLDDPRVAPWVDRAAPGVHVVTWGRAASADVRLGDVELDPVGLTTTLTVHAGGQAATVVLPAFGTHFAANATAAVAVAVSLGVPLDRAVQDLSSYAPVGMRQRIEHLADGTLVINDAYNANPASVRAALDTLAALGGRGVAALGDMLELGEHEAAMHAEIVQHATSLGLEQIVLVGPRMARAAEQVGALHDPSLHTFADALTAGRSLVGSLGSQVRLLVKGSRGMAMEQILHPLQAEA